MNNTPMTDSRPCLLNLGDIQLQGDVQTPPNASALVVFVHGSGSSRRSPRNREVARYFNAAGLATLLFDLLTDEENRVDEFTAELRFDISLLTRRLLAVLDALPAQVSLLPVALYGASTGAAAALNVAALMPERIAAVVSRGGRTDLASADLQSITAPVLLIVGEFDLEVLHWNRSTLRHMQGTHALEIVKGATHLFEEPGCLQHVSELACAWFLRHVSEHL